MEKFICQQQETAKYKTYHTHTLGYSNVTLMRKKSTTYTHLFQLYNSEYAL